MFHRILLTYQFNIRGDLEDFLMNNNEIEPEYESQPGPNGKFVAWFPVYVDSDKAVFSIVKGD